MSGVFSRSGATDFKFQYVYNTEDRTFTAPRTRWINKDTGKVWDATNEDYKAHADTPDPDDTVVAMTDHTATIGGWLIVVPTHADFIDGTYDLLIVENAANTTVLVGKHAVVKGGVIVSMQDL